LKYTGTHTNSMMNQSGSDFDLCFFDIKRGDRIAQMVISRVPRVYLERVNSLSETVRGTGGLGSTGVK
jgi:dUTPase